MADCCTSITTVPPVEVGLFRCLQSSNWTFEHPLLHQRPLSPYLAELIAPHCLQVEGWAEFNSVASSLLCTRLLLASRLMAAFLRPSPPYTPLELSRRLYRLCFLSSRFFTSILLLSFQGHFPIPLPFSRSFLSRDHGSILLLALSSRARSLTLYKFVALHIIAINFAMRDS